jgi:hypothetical protein
MNIKKNISHYFSNSFTSFSSLLFLPYLGNNNYYWHAVLHTVPLISSFLIAGADQMLMSSFRGLPSGYAVLSYMLDAQLFLSLNPYFRDTTVLGVTQVIHQGYKHLDMILFSWTGCDYIWHGMSHNPPKTTTKNQAPDTSF